MISTHILDTSTGTPAGGVTVRLQMKSGETWKEISKAPTNADGRHAFDCDKTPGTYQLVFEVGSYLKSRSKEYFYESIPVVFRIENTERKYHVPLLLNPFGYSTYRGS